jgi:hypothetical protein
MTYASSAASCQRCDIELDGHTLKGERAQRKVPVCGPAAFVVLKALAFGDRSEPKDAYDLVYVVRHTLGRGEAIAERLQIHSKDHGQVVARALTLLARDFSSPSHIGPLRAAAFAVATQTELRDAAADAHGFVDDLLRAAQRLRPDAPDA